MRFLNPQNLFWYYQRECRERENIRFAEATTMKQSWLNHLMALSGHKNQLGQLDLTKTASDLIDKNDARKHIFCKFN